jgi:hypothetical protein
MFWHKEKFCFLFKQDELSCKKIHFELLAQVSAELVRLPNFWQLTICEAISMK